MQNKHILTKGQTETHYIKRKQEPIHKPTPSRFRQLGYFFLILFIGTIFMSLVYLLLTPDQWAWFWKLTIIYFIPPAGKETVIPAGLGVASSLGIGVAIPAFILGASIWVFDILACLAIVTNWWILEFFINHIPPIPFLGVSITQKPRIFRTHISLKSWYDGLHHKTQTIEKRKYGTILPFALFIFMFIPFQGTGAMSTTIIGTLIGLRRWETIGIVTIVSFISIVAMILLSIGILTIF